MPDKPEEDRERLLEDFLQGGPRSEEWREWREALGIRLNHLKRQLTELGESGSEAERKTLEGMIEETQTQINALATEEVISEFVESEIELSLNSVEKEEEFGNYDEFEDSDEPGDYRGNGRG